MFFFTVKAKNTVLPKKWLKQCVNSISLSKVIVLARYRETDRPTDRQTYRQTHRHILKNRFFLA